MWDGSEVGYKHSGSLLNVKKEEYEHMVIQDSLLYHFRADDESSILLDGSGNVSTWYSQTVTGTPSTTVFASQTTVKRKTFLWEV